MLPRDAARPRRASTHVRRMREPAANCHSPCHTPQPHGCYGMISFSLPFREGGGTSFKLGKLAAAPPRGVQEPNDRVPLDPVGEAVPLEGDKRVIRLGECEGLVGLEAYDKNLDGDGCGPD